MWVGYLRVFRRSVGLFNVFVHLTVYMYVCVCWAAVCKTNCYYHAWMQARFLCVGYLLLIKHASLNNYIYTCYSLYCAIEFVYCYKWRKRHLHYKNKTILVVWHIMHSFVIHITIIYQHQWVYWCGKLNNNHNYIVVDKICHMFGDHHPTMWAYPVDHWIICYCYSKQCYS